jgi:hypothetical protein
MPSRVSLELSRKMLPCLPYSITLSGQITFDYASHIIIAKDSASTMLAARAEETHTHTHPGRWHCVVAFRFCRVLTWGVNYGGAALHWPLQAVAFGHPPLWRFFSSPPTHLPTLSFTPSTSTP